MIKQDITGRWEQRWHPLREEWVMIAAHRQDRPWVGKTVYANSDALPAYDPTCNLCPGNERISGIANPIYQDIFVFDNDHPCVSAEAPSELTQPTGIYRNQPCNGLARVICYSSNHNTSLAQMPKSQIENLMGVWQAQMTEFAEHPDIKSATIFENKGEVVGVSNPHPHGQIYAPNFIFKSIEVAWEATKRHHDECGRPIFQDILDAEKKDEKRIIFENETAIVFIPYFARYAYEVFVAPKKTHPTIMQLSDAEITDLAKALKVALVKLDNLWQFPLPYVMPLHQAPVDGGNYDPFHFHIELYPPLRKPNLMKYIAGAELGGGNFLSDTLPEEKAEELKALPTIHYKEKA